MFMKKILLFIILISIGVTIFYFNKTKEFYKFLNSLEKETIEINDYYIYGTHLNIEGTLTDDLIDKDVKLLLKSNKNELKYEINIDDLSFNLSELKNEGINLENIPEGKYYLLLSYQDDEEPVYYGLKDTTKYHNTYYSISDKKITIDKDKYMFINVKNEKTPDNIYDIVIDPGHGGSDPGASNGNYNESDLTLEYSKLLKSKLEKYGYKVKLTRDNDERLVTYGKGSRTAISYETKAKYLFSIHFNSNEYYVSNAGFEIYVPTLCNLNLAQKIRDDITSNLDISYSNNNSFKDEQGIYLRNLSYTDIENMRNEAIEKGYEPYEVKENTPYLYMIRETGGSIMNALIDGRDTSKDKNPYYNSNQASESYLLELGYINNKSNLYYIVDHKNEYTNVLAKSIHEYIKKDS